MKHLEFFPIWDKGFRIFQSFHRHYCHFCFIIYIFIIYILYCGNYILQERNLYMKVQFDKDALLAALTPAASVAPGRNTIKAIEGILFECPGPIEGTCQLTAYDMEKGLRTSVEATILQEGSFIINSQNILQIVRSLPAGQLLIDVDEKNRVHISSGSSTFEINALPGDNFPSLPLLSGDRNYTLSQYELRDLITKTIFAISQNAQKPIFTGVYFSVEDNVLRCVGCDGNRLGLAETTLGEKVPNASFIVPGKILMEIMRMIKDSEEEITVSLARKHVIFQIDGYTYFSRLIDGEYLNYNRILPEAYNRTVYIDTASLMHAVERASIVTEDKLGGSNSKTYIKLEFEENLLKISSSSAGGSVYEELPISMEGETLIIAFNCRYLMDALKAVGEAERICLKMNGPLMGMSIKAAEGDEKKEKMVDYTLFIMPLRMNGK